MSKRAEAVDAEEDERSGNNRRNNELPGPVPCQIELARGFLDKSYCFSSLFSLA